MTEAQKERIRELRLGGLGYVRIARELSISENTVKSFCRRAEKQEQTETPAPAGGESSTCFCRQCGVEIKQIPGRKIKKFCSDKCRMAWWNAHPEQMNRRSLHENICPRCGRKFQTVRRNSRKYCGRDCYLAARYGGGDARD